MTEPENASAAPASAAPPIPATVQDLGTEGGLAAGQVAVTTAPRKRRRWPAFLIGGLVLLGLAAGLVVWAPWTPPPPVLRPTGLVADPATTNSIAFHWSRPPTGPLPDKYLIFMNDAKIATVAGTVTAYRQASLDPATAYQYFVVAVRSGKRSAKSPPLNISTLTPPVSAARLQGSWQVYIKNVAGAPSSDNGYMTWQFTPVCALGACDVTLRATAPKVSFTMKLTRVGAAYKGQGVGNFGACGTGASAIPDPETVKVQIHISGAAVLNHVWRATSLAGTMLGTSQYVSSGTLYCNASTLKADVSGSSS